MNLGTTNSGRMGTHSGWAGELSRNPLRPKVIAARPGLRNFHHALGPGVLVTKEIREEEIIGPQDTRQKINGTDIPFRWICALKTRFRDPDSSRVIDFDAGSGLLIGPQCVLTAAHNVYANITGSRGTVLKQKALLTRVYPGRRAENDFPFGSAESEAYMYLPKFEPDLDVRFDYALIKLKTPIGNRTFDSLSKKPLGWWGSKDWGAGSVITPLSRTYLQNRIVNVAGYPNDKNHEPHNAYDVVNNSNPTVKGASVPEIITYLVDTKDGQSGAPVWRYLKDTGKRCLVAVHHGTCVDALDGCKTSPRGKPTSNLGVLITNEVITQIEAWKKTM